MEEGLVSLDLSSRDENIDRTKNPRQHGMGFLILTETENYSAFGSSTAAGSSKPYLLRKRSTRPSVSIIF
jgi:hypothetical protein